MMESHTENSEISIAGTCARQGLQTDFATGARIPECLKLQSMTAYRGVALKSKLSDLPPIFVASPFKLFQFEGSAFLQLDQLPPNTSKRGDITSKRGA